MVKIIKNKILLILCAGYILFRLTVLFTSPYLFDYEESRIGLIAKEIIDGPKLPVWEYQSMFGSHQGGLLLNGLFVIPLFSIFGEYGVVIKLLWLIISLATLITMFLFLQKFLNKQIAILSCLFFILSPQFFTIRNLADGSGYTGAVLFTILIMYFFYNIFFNNKQKFKDFALFGVICGFALFFELSSLVMIFTCILFWYLFDKKFFLKKEFFVFLAFFLIGFSPWLCYNFTHDFMGYHTLTPSKFFQSSQTDNFILASGSKFIKLVAKDIPDSFNSIDWNFRNGDYFEYTFYLKFLNYGYYLMFFVSFFYLIYLNRKKILKAVTCLIPLNKFSIKPNKIGKEVFILAYPVIYVIIFSLSRYYLGPAGWSKGYRYILPIYPFIFMIISLFITNWFNKKNKILKFSGISVFILILLMGISSNFNLISLSNSNLENNSLYKPYNYELFAESLGHSCSIRNVSCKNQCSKLNDEHIPYCYKSIGRGVSVKIRFKYNKSIKECEELGGKKNYCYIGVGFGTRENLNIDLSILKCNKLDIENRVYCYQGLGFGLAEDLIRRGIHEIPSTGIKECNRLNKEHQQYCYKGLSEGVALAYRHLPASGLKECIKLPKEYQSYCLRSPYLAYEK